MHGAARAACAAQPASLRSSLRNSPRRAGCRALTLLRCSQLNSQLNSKLHRSRALRDSRERPKPVLSPVRRQTILYRSNGVSYANAPAMQKQSVRAVQRTSCKDSYFGLTWLKGGKKGSRAGCIFRKGESFPCASLSRTRIAKMECAASCAANHEAEQPVKQLSDTCWASVRHHRAATTLSGIGPA